MEPYIAILEHLGKSPAPKNFKRLNDDDHFKHSLMWQQFQLASVLWVWKERASMIYGEIVILLHSRQESRDILSDQTIPSHNSHAPGLVTSLFHAAFFKTATIII